MKDEAGSGIHPSAFIFQPSCRDRGIIPAMSHLPPGHSPPPLPVAPLDVLPYTEPATHTRPGVIGAMGVASIVIGGLAIAWGLFASFMSFGLYLAAVGFGSQANVIFDPAGPNGFDTTDRTVITRALALQQPLTQGQKDQLDWFLADIGTVYLAPVTWQASGDVAVDYGNANVTGSGTDVEGGAAHFEVPMGRLTVTESAVSIALKDGTTITRSRTRQMPNPADPSQLSAEEIAAVVNRVQERNSGAPLSAGQKAALAGEIQTHAAGLIGTPADLPELLAQVRNVQNMGGPVYVYFHRGSVYLPASGPAVTTVTGPNPNRAGVPDMKPVPSVLLIIACVMSTVLAVYLLVIGILTLRNSPMGRRLHKIYAWLKLVVTAMATASLVWLIMAAGGKPEWAALAGFALLLTGAVYPIILLCVLAMRSVRNWYTADHPAV